MKQDFRPARVQSLVSFKNVTSIIRALKYFEVNVLFISVQAPTDEVEHDLQKTFQLRFVSILVTVLQYTSRSRDIIEKAAAKWLSFVQMILKATETPERRDRFHKLQDWRMNF